MSVDESGYDLPFLNDVDSRYICPICLHCIRKPMQTYCGHRFCYACIKRIYGYNKMLTCPVDKQYSQVNQMFHDIAIEREIESLHTGCSHATEGCRWTGELRDLGRHKMSCQMESVPCANCDVSVRRRDMADHETTCPNRTVTCDHCDTAVVYHRLSVHTSICPRALVTCDLCHEVCLPREELPAHVHPDTGSCAKIKVSCIFKEFGCTFEAERSELNKHTSNSEVHMIMLMKKIVSQDKTIKDFEGKINTLLGKTDALGPLVASNTQKTCQISKDLVERNVTGRVHWKIKLNSSVGVARKYLSPVVYTGSPGYKVQLRLDLDAHRQDHIKYASLSLCLLPGEYDDQVIFPFNATCLITMYDQTNPISQRNNYNTTMVVREVPKHAPRSARSPHYRENLYRRSVNGFFLRHDLVGQGSRFLRQGALHMEVTILHCFYPPPDVSQVPCAGPVLCPVSLGASTAVTLQDSATIMRGNQPNVPRNLHGQGSSRNTQ